MYIWYQGEYLPSETPIFKQEHRGARFGDGVFETLKIQSQKVLFLEAHIERLGKGTQILNLNLPTSFTQTETWLEIINTLMTKNKIKEGGRVRIDVYRSGAGTYMPIRSEVEIVVSATPMLANSYSLETTRKAIVYKDVPLSENLLSTIKTNNKLTYVLAAHYAKAKKHDDAILLDTEGNISEASSSNLFYVIEGKLYTPPLSSGCLSGVVRKTLLQTLEVNKQTTTFEHLRAAESVFLTNVIIGILPLSYITGIGKNYVTKSKTLKNILATLQKNSF